MAGRISYLGGIVTQGLVLNLDAAKRDSYSGVGNIWRNISDNQNNGILENTPTFSSANGGSIVFDGTNEYVNLPNNTVNYATRQITVEAYVRPLVSFASNGMSILVQGTSCNQCSFSLMWGRVSNSFSWFAGDAITISTTGLTQNNWYHIVGVRSSGGVNLFVNGILNNTTVSSGNGTGVSTSLSIGESINCSVVPNWNGNIAIVRLYNRALSATEVLQNYNATRVRFGI